MPENTHTIIQKDTRQYNPLHSRLWYRLSAIDTLSAVGSVKQGLTADQVQSRLARYGTNELPRARRTGVLVLFVSQFKNSLTYVLLIATAVSFMLGEIIDVYVILAAVGVNVIVGFVQEFKAEHALAALQRVMTQTMWVVREGKEREVESAELVPGDVVLIAAGTRLPADGRLIEVEQLKISEAVLTGESEAVVKHVEILHTEKTLAQQHNMVWSGTTVAEGRGRFVVTATGTRTEIGKIATLVRDTKEVRTPLQKTLDRFSRKLAYIVFALSGVLFGVGMLFGYTATEMFTIAVAVAVSAIPEGLVIGVTVVLAIGMQRILKKGSLVRKLAAAETLGSTSVICTDKTGTLTVGEMRAVRLVSASHDIDRAAKTTIDATAEKSLIELKHLHQIGIMCSNAVLSPAIIDGEIQAAELTPEIIMGTPTEKALLLAALSAGFSEKEARAERPRHDEIHFSSEKKFMATLHAWTEKQNIVYIKGAPEKILLMCATYQNGKNTSVLSAAERTRFEKKIESLSKEGLRVLAACYKTVPAAKTTFAEIADWQTDAVFVGVWGLKDPLRPEARDTIATTAKAGIRTIMITGDNRHTAQAIAAELGLSAQASEILDGADLAALSESQLASAVTHIKVFSRATPEDKLRIVRALQSHGHVVAMTGDGVNDAPALQSADIGIALGSGTDVAKETADIVLLDNNFSTIVAAVREGRVIFDNVKKIILYLLSDSFVEMIIIVAGLLMGWPLALIPVQILWINLATDGLPHMALALEPEEPEVMNERPRAQKGSIFDTEGRFLMFFISGLTGLTTIGLFVLIMHTTGELERARTVAFTMVGVSSLLYVFSIRSVRHTIFNTRLFQNKWLIAAVFGGFMIQLASLYIPFLNHVLQTVPLSVRELVLILVACAWVIGAIELAKHYFIVQRARARKRSA